MKVLVACESSGTVREAFRNNGHDAWSCDLLPADDGSDYHIQGDGVEAVRGGQWDLIICHPPCTHIAVSGAAWFKDKIADGRQQEGIDLFMAFVDACSDSGARWAIENPVCIMSSKYRYPDQIIQPWMFGHKEQKATQRIHYTPPGPDRWKIRSKTFDGIAEAMASQWDIDDYQDQPKDQLSIFS
jgi:hypothetical protein